MEELVRKLRGLVTEVNATTAQLVRVGAIVMEDVVWTQNMESSTPVLNIRVLVDVEKKRVLK